MDFNDLTDCDLGVAVSGDIETREALVTLVLDHQCLTIGGYRQAMAVAIAITQAAEHARNLQYELDSHPDRLITDLFEKENLRLNASDN